MFTVSARARYGLAAIVELALNFNIGQTQIKDIAEAQGIPQHYLEQLLLVLKKAGFVKSFRGVQGGYALAQSPSHIYVLDIINCLEGELGIVGDWGKSDNLYFFWNRIEVEIRNLFNLTVEKLILEKQAYDKRLSYNI